MKRFLILFTLFFLSFQLEAWSFEVIDTKSNEPIFIKSEEVNIYRSEGKIYFLNNVIAKQGDLKLLAQKMTIDYREEKEKSEMKANISKIFAEKSVELFTKTIHALSDKGTYDLKTGLVVLEDNLKFEERGSTVFGKKMIYNVNTKETQIIGDTRKIDNRVTIIIDDIKDTQKRAKETKKK